MLLSVPAVLEPYCSGESLCSESRVLEPYCLGEAFVAASRRKHKNPLHIATSFQQMLRSVPAVFEPYCLRENPYSESKVLEPYCLGESLRCGVSSKAQEPVPHCHDGPTDASKGHNCPWQQHESLCSESKVLEPYCLGESLRCGVSAKA